jgi:cytoplasmic iron level regulating protein YaaA (DUF328/UPF0246 family)
MLVVISPAKTLDFETSWKLKNISQPDFLHDSQLLIDQLRKLSATKIGEMMSISDKLAMLNSERFLNWHLPFTSENAKPAVLAFRLQLFKTRWTILSAMRNIICRINSRFLVN